MLEINKGLKVSFHDIVLPLCLAVYLRVKSGKESPFDAEKVAKQLPEFRVEKQASIRYN